MKAASYVDAKPNPQIPDFRPGDSVRVHAKVVEGDRQRIQVFEGVVLRIKRGGVSSSFTVRRVTHGIGVERVFPYYSPLVDKVEVTRVGRGRPARLYYLRDRLGKAGRIKPGSRARFDALTKQGAVAAEAEYIEEEEPVGDEDPTVEEEMAEEEAAADAEEAIVEPEEAESEAGAVAAEEPAPEATIEQEPVAEADEEPTPGDEAIATNASDEPADDTASSE